VSIVAFIFFVASNGHFSTKTDTAAASPVISFGAF
jgi:hypothetical protein